METAKQNEDLSKLKGPKWWYGWGALVFAVMAALLISVVKSGVSHSYLAWLLIATLWTPFAVCVLCFFWSIHNLHGHTVWWWKDADGKWRVTAEKYPQTAKGLVIEVLVKARPRFTLRWGSKGWREVREIPATTEYVSRNGSRLVSPSDNGELDTAGITREVRDFLYCAQARWKIIPLDAGRTLRFVDSCGKGVEVFWNGLDGVDLEEIMRSQDCAAYHRRMQEKARAHDEAYSEMYEVLQALRLPTPIFDETLVERVKQARAAADDRYGQLEMAWAQLCHVLVVLRDDAEKHAGRPKAKLGALQRVSALLVHLNVTLPTDLPVRESHNISPGELDRVDSEIKALKAQLAQGGATARTEA